MALKICRSFLLAIFIIISVLISSCGKKEKREIGELSRQENELAETVISNIKPKALNYDSLFVVISQLTEALKKNPTDVDLQQQLVAVSYDTTWETILAVGCGERSTAASTETVSEKFLQQAATADAYRWAAYVKKWHTDPTSTELDLPGSTVSGGKIVLIKKLSDEKMSVLIEIRSSMIQ